MPYTLTEHMDLHIYIYTQQQQGDRREHDGRCLWVHQPVMMINGICLRRDKKNLTIRSTADLS